MKNEHLWKETKFIQRRNKLIGSRNVKIVAHIGRMITDLTASEYSSAFQKYAHGDLLDLGCGFVPLYAAYKPYVQSVTCIDWENTYHKNEHIDMYCDLNEPLPLDDNSFDTIVLSDVLEHIRNPDLLIKEVYRILRNGGVLLLNSPFMYHVHEAPYDYFRYTRHYYEDIAENVGFQKAIVKEIGGLIESYAYMTMRFPHFLSRLNILPLSLVCNFTISCILFLYRVFSKTRLARYIQSQTHMFPLSYFVVMLKDENKFN